MQIKKWLDLGIFRSKNYISRNFISDNLTFKHWHHQIQAPLSFYFTSSCCITSTSIIRNTHAVLTVHRIDFSLRGALREERGAKELTKTVQGTWWNRSAVCFIPIPFSGVMVLLFLGHGCVLLIGSKYTARRKKCWLDPVIVLEHHSNLRTKNKNGKMNNGKKHRNRSWIVEILSIFPAFPHKLYNNQCVVGELAVR